MQGLRIAVAGAGTAGLAAALFLARDGHDVTLLERFTTPQPVGAGIMLQPTGLACLACLGLDAVAMQLGRRIDGIHGRTVRERPIFDFSYALLGPRAFAVGIHRGALFSMLYDAVLAERVPIRTGVEVRAAPRDGDRRTLLDAAGSKHGPFDLIVDATGMRTPLRAAWARVRLDRANPYGAVWGVVAEPAGWPHPDQLQQRYDGCRIMIGLLPIGRRPGEERTLTAVFWSLRVQDYPAWRAAGLDAWRAQVVQLWPQARPFVEQFQRIDELALAAYADIVLARPDGERIVCIGDASRAASPQLGQGANLALIDARALAHCLKTGGDVVGALAHYRIQRRAQTRFYSLASRLLTPFFQSDSRLAGITRDLTFAHLARVPYLRREMARMLAGVKTGPFAALDPGDWHEAYRLG